jgi:DNA invertase Pin-like site-specific DNA recombinase
MKKALALIRVSTDAQDTARQKTDLERLKAAHNLIIEREIPLEAEDGGKGVSGRAVLKHPEMQKALRDLKRPDIDGFAVSALDRLFRPDNYSDFSILDHFRQTGKVIFSAKEGVIDPASDMGFLVSLFSGAMAGQEWRTLRQRTLDGKREMRKLGRNVNGKASLPDGLLYRRVTNASGRTIDGIWSYDEEKVGKIREAYRILFADHAVSITALAKRVGWSCGFSLRRTLQNTVWRGVRISAPMAGETEPLEIRLPLEPVLTDDQWALAQTLLAKRRTWSRETRDQRHLGAGLLACRCGRKYYIHCDVRRGQHDDYACSSRHPRGKGCGAARLRRVIVDEAILRVTEAYLTDPKFLAAVFRRIEQVPAPDHAEKRERELARLAARRRKWIVEYDEDRITKQEFDERLAVIEKAVHEVEAKMPAVPPPPVDYRAVIAGLVRVLARLRSKPFPEQRKIVKTVIRSITVVDGHASEVVLSGSFLGQFPHTKTAQPSRWPYWSQSRARGLPSPRERSRAPCANCVAQTTDPERHPRPIGSCLYRRQFILRC